MTLTTTAAPGAMPATPIEDIERALAELDAHKAAWVATGIATRVAIIDQIRRDMAALLPEWVRLCLLAKGLPPAAPQAGDEWGAVAFNLRQLRLLRRTLRDIAAHGSPLLPGVVTTRPDGQVVARVLPGVPFDRLLFPGMVGDVWMQPGVNQDMLHDTLGSLYRSEPQPGGVALVLGAGNYSPLATNDLLHKLFQENQVVILKMNPVNDYLGPLIEQGYRALIERGFLRVVYGGADVGSALIEHPLVEAVHLTGSLRTYERIVFGADSNHTQPRQPRLTKPLSAELGNITPVIVVPGPWRAHDIAFHAAHIAGMLVTNAGFNCVTPRVLIQHAGWPQRQQFNDAIGAALAAVPTRPAYYPGAHDIHAAFMAQYPHARQYGVPADGHLPWTYITDVDPRSPDEMCFTTEAFCGLLAETALPAASVPDYIDRAADFANERLWGTLAATVLVHPHSLRDPAVAAALERAIARLRYGTIAVNFWGVLGIFLGQIPWGGHAGSDIADVQSGIGFVNNTFMIARPQKSVIRAPFKSTLVPLFTTNRHYAAFYEKLACFEADEALWRLPAIVRDALTGRLF
jgi:acyl-CoA reductase-like NAD-dependent aldehyde dehydrogenase